MSDALREAELYGPGSANHMLMSSIRQKAFGFDPEMKDDGNGTVPGTRSYYIKNTVDPIKANNENVKYIRSVQPQLTEGQNKFMNLVASKTNDLESMRKAIDFVRSTDMSQINESNLDMALEKDDFGQMLFQDIDQSNFLTDKEASQFEYKNMI